MEKRILRKLLLLDKTKVKCGPLMNNNDLGCLNFDGCHSDYQFEPSTKHLYSRISATERQVQEKM